MSDGVPTMVFNANRGSLEMFPHRELCRYAKSLGVATGRTKPDTIKRILESGKARISLCFCKEMSL